MKKFAVFAVLLALLAGAALLAFTLARPPIAPDEMLLKIQLDTEEDIGLLVISFQADGFSGSGGTSNADKTMLKRNDLLYYTIGGEEYDNAAGGKEITLQFTVITEYVTPNFENVYPPAYTKPLEEIQFYGTFGQAYAFTLTGNKNDGYTAVLNG